MRILNEDELVEYLTTLIHATKAGKVNWEGAPQTPESAFLAKLENTVVWIYSKDHDDRHPYAFTIDTRNDEVGVSDATLELVRVESDPDVTPLNSLLEDLYAAAKGKVLGLDDIRATLLADLEQLKRR